MTGAIIRKVSQRRGETPLHRQPLPSGSSHGKVCKFWLTGNCTRNPCRFLHPETGAPKSYVLRLNRSGSKESHGSQGQMKVIRKRANEEFNSLKQKKEASSEDAVEGCDPSEIENKVHPCSASANERDTQKVQPKICEDWVNKNCVYGEKCKYLHSWSYGDGFSMLAQLEGHKKAVTGITLPSGSDKLFSSSNDGTVQVWNCHTGECICVADMGAPVGCLISEGPWVFAGTTNTVKAWNIQTNAEFTLTAPAEQVYTMVATHGMLLAGVHDGSILVWKFNSEANTFEPTASLKGHTDAVVSLIVGANRLYSGSTDNTIRVWDLENMQCIHTLTKHSEVVMSMICWESYLLSCSLDHTLKVWAATETGEIDVTYTHNEEHGILSLSGMRDKDDKPILLCSCNDNSVRLYELPSFVERGRIFASQEVRAIHVGPEGLFFTGDGSGLVSVWRCPRDSTASPDKSA